VSQQLQVLFLPFLACLVLTGIHVYLGIHVISRKVIFVDIALAQIAALGATVAFLLGYDVRSNGAYFLSLGFAILAAVIFALTRTKHERVPQEAIIGLTYATASAAAILLADISPHGAEHLHDLLAGSIVWVTPAQITKTVILYTLIGLFHFAFRKNFLLISLHPEKAYTKGLNVRFWDFLFYLSFGFVITSSVQIAGVLLVFCYLVAPSVFAVMFFDDLKRRLITGWAMATVVSAIGLLFSYDRPSGPTIMVCFALALVLGGTVRAIVTAGSRPRALAIAGATAAAMILAGWLLILFRPGPAAGHPDDAGASVSMPATAGAAAPGATPEHEVGSGMEDLRRALGDTHENVRVAAVAQVAATGDPRILPDLVNALHDQAPAVREAAAQALGRTGSRAAVPPLKHALRNADEDAWVRLRVAQALAGLGEPEGLEILLELARGDDARLARMEALSSFLRLTGQGDPASPDPDSKDGAALLKRLNEFWRKRGKDLKWDDASRAFR